MTAKDIIARAVAADDWDWPEKHGRAEIRETCLRQAEDVMSALAAAGYRIIIGSEADDPATTVYGRLLRLHMEAARKDFRGERRTKLFDLVEAFSAEFPAECKVWEDRYASDPEPAP